MQPLVSAIIPTYNRSAALRPTIESVLAQTYENWELVVVDDGSTDDTGAVVREYTSDRVRYVYQGNTGVAGARNRGLTEARGVYVAFLDHDDRWREEKLAAQVEFLERRPDCGLVYAGIFGIDESGTLLGEVQVPDLSGILYEELLCRGNFVFTMSNPLIRTSCLLEAGGFDVTADISDDWDLFLRLSRITSFGRLDGALTGYNFGNPSAQTRDVFRVYASEARIVAKYHRSGHSVGPELARGLKRAFRRRFGLAFREEAWRALCARDHRRAASCYGHAWRLYPTCLMSLSVFKDLLALLRSSARGAFASRDRRGAAGTDV
jgi:glycosyltransferase involved in cell wall biosynthesis